jgi:hypothetical protein
VGIGRDRNRGRIDELPEPNELLGEAQRRDLPLDLDQYLLDARSRAADGVESGLTLGPNKPLNGIIDRLTRSAHLNRLVICLMAVEPELPSPRGSTPGPTALALAPTRSSTENAAYMRDARGPTLIGQHSKSH